MVVLLKIKCMHNNKSLGMMTCQKRSIKRWDSLEEPLLSSIRIIEDPSSSQKETLIGLGKGFLKSIPILLTNQGSCVINGCSTKCYFNPIKPGLF